MSVVAPPERPRPDELELLIREARARQRKRWMSAACATAAIAGAVVAAYAIAGGTSSKASRAGGPTSAAVDTCRGSQLAISFVRKGAVMGEEGGMLRFTNVGGASCRISGWPDVRAVEANGRDVRASRTVQSMLFATDWQHGRPVQTVTLRPGVSGYAVVGGGDNPIGRPPTWPCPVARRLLVRAPGSRRQAVLSGFLWRSPEPVYLPLCGGRPWVEPIRPRPHLAH